MKCKHGTDFCDICNADRITDRESGQVDNFVSGKPPLGLVPKKFRQHERFIEVCEAISRYWHTNMKIPVKWIEEYNELIDICR